MDIFEPWYSDLILTDEDDGFPPQNWSEAEEEDEEEDENEEEDEDEDENKSREDV